MRISDWSSDVCSSDLLGRRPFGDIRAHGVKCGGKPVIAFVPLEEVADTGGKLRPEACSALDGIRELGRMCSGERHHRDRRIDVAEASGGKYDRSVRRSEEHTTELQPLMRTSSAVFCLKKKKDDR